MKRIAIVVSHPIQHFCPQYSSVAGIEGIVLKVFFGSSMGADKYFDPLFGKEISWGNLYLDSFDHEFVNGKDVIPVTAKLDAPNLPDRLTEFKPDLVVVYGYSQALSRRAIKWCNENNVKCGYISDSELNNRRGGFLKGVLKRVFFTYYFRKIDYFLWVGNSNREYYIKYGVSDAKLVRMHFPIDIRHYERAVSLAPQLRKDLRGKMKIAADEFVIVVVGKLVEWKSQHHLVQLAKFAENEGRPITVIMVGSGEQEARLKQDADDLRFSKVLFAGFVSPEDLPSYYAASDVYIHPAEYEPHSLAVSEAIFMGRPVIVSDRCGSYGPDDDLQVERNGFVYEYANVEQLYEYVKRLMDNKETLMSFGAASARIGRELQNISHGNCWRTLAAKV